MDSIYHQKKPFNNNKSNNNDKEGGPAWEVRESCSHNLIHKFLGPNSLSGRPVVYWASSIIDANALIYWPRAEFDERYYGNTSSIFTQGVHLCVQDAFFERSKEKAWKKLLK